MSTSTGAIKQHGLVNRGDLIHIRSTAVADTPRTNTLHLPIVYSVNPTFLAKDSVLAQLRTDLETKIVVKKPLQYLLIQHIEG